MIFTIKGTQIEVVESLHEYVEKKIKTLEKYLDTIVSIDVEIGCRTRHHQSGKIFFAEANVSVPGKKMLRAEHTDTDLYKAIDKVHDELKRELIRHKEMASDKKKRDARRVKS